jgi:hypothetical protein
LVKRLATKSKGLTVVGDPDQVRLFLFSVARNLAPYLLILLLTVHIRLAEVSPQLLLIDPKTNPSETRRHIFSAQIENLELMQKGKYRLIPLEPGLRLMRDGTDFKPTTQLFLEENYRSTSSILAASLAVVSQGASVFALLS